MCDEKSQYPGLVLMYHGVDPGDGRFDALLAGERAYCLDGEVFKRHLERIGSSPYRLGDPGKSEHPAPGELWLSFDDGWSSDHDIVLPLLAARRQSALFFVTSDWVNKEGHVSWEDLMTMEKAGMRIGSHGRSHALLESLSGGDQLAELRSSRDALESALGHPVVDLSLPGGSLNALTVEQAGNAGYSRVFTSNPGDFREDDGMAVVGRVAVRRDWNADWLGRLLDDPRPALAGIVRRTLWKGRIRKWMGPRWYKRLHERFWKG